MYECVLTSRSHHRNIRNRSVFQMTIPNPNWMKMKSQVVCLCTRSDGRMPDSLFFVLFSKESLARISCVNLKFHLFIIWFNSKRKEKEELGTENNKHIYLSQVSQVSPFFSLVYFMCCRENNNEKRQKQQKQQLHSVQKAATTEPTITNIKSNNNNVNTVKSKNARTHNNQIHNQRKIDKNKHIRLLGFYAFRCDHLRCWMMWLAQIRRE